MIKATVIINNIIITELWLIIQTILIRISYSDNKFQIWKLNIHWTHASTDTW